MGLFGPPNIEKMKARRDIKGLVKALKYKKDWGVRKLAADALGEMGDARAVESLIAMLRDREWSLRSSAASALGGIGDSRAVEPLIAMLQDRERSVRSSAIKALDKIGWQPGQDEKGAVYWAAKHRWDECIRLGPIAIEPLIAALKYSGTDVHKSVAVALGQIGTPRAVERLIPWLRDDRIRESAIDALGIIGIPAIEPLIAMFRDRDWSVRRSAADALCVIGTPAIEPLIAALKDYEWEVRRLASETLDKIGWQPGQDERGAAYWITKQNWEECIRLNSTAVEPLIRTLKDNNKAVRDSAIYALGKIGDARAVEPLIVMLKDSEWSVRRSAADALDMMGWQPGQDERGVLYWVAKQRWDECIRFGSTAVDPLIAALKYESVSGSAVSALEQIGSPAVDPLIAALKDGDKGVRKSAVDALGKIGDARTVDQIIKALNDNEWSVRKIAAKALIMFYHSGHISDTHKQLILDQRDCISRTHEDKLTSHRVSSDCSPPPDHTDQGIGIPFPI